MIVALLERGRAMALDDIARRLDTAGVPALRVGFAEALVKAWHGLKPIHREPDGALGLDVTARALDYQLSVLRLRPPMADLLPQPGPLTMPGDDVPAASMSWTLRSNGCHHSHALTLARPVATLAT
jgi:hypothetical protein